MRARRVVLGLLEAVCAIVAMLLTLLLALHSSFEHLRAAYNNDIGGLAWVLAVLVVAWAGWLVLWRRRTRRHRRRFDHGKFPEEAGVRAPRRS